MTVHAFNVSYVQAVVQLQFVASSAKKISSPSCCHKTLSHPVRGRSRLQQVVITRAYALIVDATSLPAHLASECAVSLLAAHYLSSNNGRLVRATVAHLNKAGMRKVSCRQQLSSIAPVAHGASCLITQRILTEEEGRPVRPYRPVAPLPVCACIKSSQNPMVASCVRTYPHPARIHFAEYLTVPM